MKIEEEKKQWEFCPNCGQQKVPHPKTEEMQDYTWMVCPSEVEYRAGRAPRYLCPPPPVLAAPFVHGAYYRGICRNAQIARYNAETDRFIYMREKFGYVYPEDICHAGCDNGFDLFRPYGLVENPPFEIPLVVR
jgi:hypothetical protein